MKYFSSWGRTPYDEYVAAYEELKNSEAYVEVIHSFMLSFLYASFEHRNQLDLLGQLVYGMGGHAVLSVLPIEKIVSFVAKPFAPYISKNYAKFLLWAKGWIAKEVLKPLGLGSTGRTLANNLTEQLAMKEIISNPFTGKILIQNMKDASGRWHGWSKMSNKTAHGVEIHYNALWENGVIKAIDDFKFINP